MKLIDVLNKIADGTLEDGSVIIYEGDLCEYDRSKNILLNDCKDGFFDNICVDIEDCLNDEVELLRRQEENTTEELEEVEELGKCVSEGCFGWEDVEANRAKIDELVRAVNKLIKK